MDKKKWINPEIIVLEIKNTEGNVWNGEHQDGEYCSWCGCPLYS